MKNKTQRKGFNLRPTTKDELSHLRGLSGQSNSELLEAGLSKLKAMGKSEIDRLLREHDKKRYGKDKKIRIIRISPSAEDGLNNTLLHLDSNSDNFNYSLLFETAISILDESDFLTSPSVQESPHLIGLTTHDLIRSLSLRKLSDEEKAQLKEIIS